MRLAIAGLFLLAACTSMPTAPFVTENVTIGGQSYPLRYTPTGDVVPYRGVGATYLADDGITIENPDATVYDDVAYPTVRVGGTTDNFRALDVWFARCAPGETYDRDDFGDEVFTLDARTAEFVFTYPCPPLAGASGDG